MINRVVLVGRLTKDPELRYTPSGIATVRFTIAINRPFKNEQGETDADFINCVAWRKAAENLANYQRKGNLIGVEGNIRTGSYEKDGQRIFTTDINVENIQFLEPRSNGASGNTNNNTNGQAGGYNNPPQYGSTNSGYGQQHQQFQQPPQQNNQNNYTRMDEDPFASNKSPIEVTEDDLPF